MIRRGRVIVKEEEMSRMKAAAMIKEKILEVEGTKKFPTLSKFPMSKATVGSDHKIRQVVTEEFRHGARGKMMRNQRLVGGRLQRLIHRGLQIGRVRARSVARKH